MLLETDIEFEDRHFFAVAHISELEGDEFDVELRGVWEELPSGDDKTLPLYLLDAKLAKALDEAFQVAWMDRRDAAEALRRDAVLLGKQLADYVSMALHSGTDLDTVRRYLRRLRTEVLTLNAQEKKLAESMS